MSCKLLFAEIVATNAESTHAVIWVFSKPILREFTGNDHKEKAQKWVDEWQDHIQREVSQLAIL